MDWHKIWMYICTGDSDMHAEREYLMKEVEPELSAWCMERKLELHMVDLRRGASWEDLEHNSRALRVCFENIDKCRPFFVGFVGQHRGWVPTEEEVSDSLLREYDGLAEVLGKYSLQELEIMHGMLKPLKKGKARSTRGILYTRSDDFQREVLKENPKLKPLFTNEPLKKSLFSKEQRANNDAQANFLKEVEKQVTVVRYQGRWDRMMPSPELKDYYGRDLSQGRLHDFSILGKSLKEHLIAHMKTEIIREFPDRKEVIEKMATERPERDLQEQESFLRRALIKCEGAGVPEDILEVCLKQPAGSRIVVSSRSGIGKTGFLARYIEEMNACDDYEVYYRFIGAGQRAVTLADIQDSLYLEMMYRIGLADDWLPETERQMMVRWPEVLKLAAMHKPVVLVIDGLKEEEYDKQAWIFEDLPQNMTLMCSVVSGEAQALKQKLHARHLELMPVNDEKFRKRLIRQFMSDIMKNVDEEEMNALLNSQGSANPLFLEAAIHELRYTRDLPQWRMLAAGENGISSRAIFHMMFKRMEEGVQCFVTKPEIQVKGFLGFLACSRMGLTVEDYPQWMTFWAENDAKKIGVRQMKEDFKVLLKQVAPFVVFDGRTCRPLQDSFAEAIREYYRDSMVDFHRVLAAVYYDMCDKYGDNSFKGTESYAFREVIHHAAKGRYEWILALLKDPAFLVAKMKHCGVMALISDYERIDVQVSPKYQQICRLLWLSMSVLEQDPEQLEAQIMIRRGSEPEPVFEEMLDKLKSMRRKWFLEPLQKYGQNLDDFDYIAEMDGQVPDHAQNNEMIGLYQSSGSLYLFSQDYSVAVSPLTLQIRKTGVPVLEYMPEVLRKKYLLHWDTKGSMLMLYNLETLQNDMIRKIPREVTEKIESAWWDEKQFVVLYRSLAGKGTVRIFKMEDNELPDAFALEKAREHVIVNGENGTFIWACGTDLDEWQLRDLLTGEVLIRSPRLPGVRLQDAFYKNGRVFYIREEKGELSLCVENVEKPEERTEAKVLYRCSGKEGLYLRGRQTSHALYQKNDGTMVVCDLAVEEMAGEYELTQSVVKACRFEKNLLYVALEDGQLCVFDLASKSMQCRAFLDVNVRKMIMTGAGLVTIWTEPGELLSFQLQKKR